jgi:hypothetical protein
MKKFTLFLILILLAGSAWGITWTKDWSAADNTFITFGGNDLKNLQDDVDSQSMSSTGDLTLTGDNTYSGDNTFSGNVTFTSIPAMITSTQTLNGTVTLSPASIYMGSFTKDTSDVSASVSYTGVGFKPRAVIFFAVESSAISSETSWGLDDGILSHAIADTDVTTEDAYQVCSFSIDIIQGAGIEYTGNTSSFDANGFTISWTKTGAKTGTETVYYIAFRQ